MIFMPFLAIGVLVSTVYSRCRDYRVRNYL